MLDEEDYTYDSRRVAKAMAFQIYETEEEAGLNEDGNTVVAEYANSYHPVKSIINKVGVKRLQSALDTLEVDSDGMLREEDVHDKIEEVLLEELSEETRVLWVDKELDMESPQPFKVAQKDKI